MSKYIYNTHSYKSIIQFTYRLEFFAAAAEIYFSNLHHYNFSNQLFKPSFSNGMPKIYFVNSFKTLDSQSQTLVY